VIVSLELLKSFMDFNENPYEVYNIGVYNNFIFLVSTCINNIANTLNYATKAKVELWKYSAYVRIQNDQSTPYGSFFPDSNGYYKRRIKLGTRNQKRIQQIYVTT